MRILIGTAVLVLFEMLVFDADAARPRSREAVGIVENVNFEQKELAVDGVRYIWTKRTTFIEDNRFTEASALKPGDRVRMNYRAPFVGDKFVTKVRWNSGSTAGR